MSKVGSWGSWGSCGSQQGCDPQDDGEHWGKVTGCDGRCATFNQDAHVFNDHSDDETLNTMRMRLLQGGHFRPRDLVVCLYFNSTSCSRVSVKFYPVKRNHYG